ncbi:MAG: zf-HC2 domain-containing protein [Oscillospiraceae bacterium]|nr:zf-HC2 domain-containing protein [Oscillospiraceae bacterium]
MMNEITCDICRDLLPLVKDGVASADSEAAVLRHTQSCPECAKLLGGEPLAAAQPPASPKALLKVKRWLMWIYAALMLLGIYFGLSLTAGHDPFYNCLIMPIAGVFGYMAFRWRAVYIMPAVLVVVSFLGNALGFITVDGVQRMDVSELISWIIIYLLFALAGMIIALLLHFAFGKTNSNTNSERGV